MCNYYFKNLYKINSSSKRYFFKKPFDLFLTALQFQLVAFSLFPLLTEIQYCLFPFDVYTILHPEAFSCIYVSRISQHRFPSEQLLDLIPKLLFIFTGDFKKKFHVHSTISSGKKSVLGVIFSHCALACVFPRPHFLLFMLCFLFFS